MDFLSLVLAVATVAALPVEQPVRVSHKDRELLRFRVPEGADPIEGTAFFRLKLDAAGFQKGAFLFSFDGLSVRFSERPFLNAFRGAAGEIKGECGHVPPNVDDTEWQDWIISWDREGVRSVRSDGFLAVTDRPGGPKQNFAELTDRRPLALPPGFSMPRAETVLVGSDPDGGKRFEGWIDGFRMTDQAMSVDEMVEALEAKRVVRAEADIHYATAGEEKKVSVRIRSVGKVDLSGCRLSLRGVRGGEVVSKAVTSATGGVFTFPTAGLKPGAYLFSVFRGESELARDFFAVLKSGNPYESEARKMPGVLDGLELVEDIDVASLVSDTNRFASVKGVRIGICNGRKYVEAGPERLDRFAVRLPRFDLSHPLYCIEIVYPDDKFRTVEINTQNTSGMFRGGSGTGGTGNILGVGYVCGREFPASGRMRSYRIPYWATREDVTLIAQTSFHGAPAALARIRVYRVRDGKLPVTEVHEPPAAPDGWHRHSVLFFEDPVMANLFGFDQSSSESLNEEIDRLAAVMKFAGQDMLTYPGAFYMGNINERGDPRVWSIPHAYSFREAIYEKFDHEGLSFMPEVNWLWYRAKAPRFTSETLSNGVFHVTAIAITTNGCPPTGVFNGTPPGYNVLHPEVQRGIEDLFDDWIAEGVRHPSFKGISMLLHRATLMQWGGIEVGYNDYCIEAFERETGVRVPVDRKDPLRGEKYAKWLLANAREKWVDWRCEVLTRFYEKLAGKLRWARPDLKLWLQCQGHNDLIHDADFFDDSHMLRVHREAGFDAAKLARIPNLIYGRVNFPLRHRKRMYWFGGKPELEARYRDYPFKAGYYPGFAESSSPYLTLRDDFIESQSLHRIQQVGKLDAPWLRELDWRCLHYNAVGHDSMKHYAVPLRFNDILGFARGGFCIANYGMEPLTARFMRNFRALPAVKFDTLTSEGCDVVVRGKAFKGKMYYYAVNVTDVPRELTFAFPQGVKALVDGRSPKGLVLEPYELKSFVLEGNAGSHVSGWTSNGCSDPRIFRGDAMTAYRDPAALWHKGMFYVFFTLVETEPDGSVHSYVAQSESRDLKDWSRPRKITPRSVADYSSPGNVVRDGDEWVICYQSYPRPGNRNDGQMRCGDGTARLFTARSRDLRTWSAPELLRVKGPSVAEKDMGRMIDPFLVKDDEGIWWCYYKQGGASISKSRDLRTWEYVGRTSAGENVCVVREGERYLMMHSPGNGLKFKTSDDLVKWAEEPGLLTLAQKDWTWARGRLTAGFLLDGRKIPGCGKWLLFFHGSGPRREAEGDFDRNASIAIACSDDLKVWAWPDSER